MLEIYHCKNQSLKGQVFVKCKSNGRLSRKLNQVALLDIHKGIFSLHHDILFVVFSNAVLVKKTT